MTTSDDELLERLADVLDRVDPMPPDLITTGRAVFTGDPAYTSTGARVPPCPAPVETPEPPAARVLAEDDGGAAGEPTHRAGLRGKQSRPVQPQTLRPQTPHATGP